MKLRTIFSLIILCFLLFGCAGTRSFYGDDVYLVKPNDLPLGESINDQTSYASFKERNRTNRVSDVYYAVPSYYFMDDCFNTLFWNTGCRYSSLIYRPNSYYFYSMYPNYGYYHAFGYPYYDPYFGYMFPPYLGYHPYYNYYGYDPYFNYYGYPHYYDYSNSGTGIYYNGPRKSNSGFANPRAGEIIKKNALITDGSLKNGIYQTETKNYRTKQTVNKTEYDSRIDRTNKTYISTDHKRPSYQRNNSNYSPNRNFNSRPINNNGTFSKPSRNFENKGTYTPSNEGGRNTSTPTNRTNSNSSPGRRQ